MYRPLKNIFQIWKIIRSHNLPLRLYILMNNECMYLDPLTSLLILFFINCFSRIIMNPAKVVNTAPWPASPNITLNRNGNVTIVYKAAKKTKNNEKGILYLLSIINIVNLFFDLQCVSEIVGNYSSNRKCYGYKFRNSRPYQLTKFVRWEILRERYSLKFYF